MLSDIDFAFARIVAESIVISVMRGESPISVNPSFASADRIALDSKEFDVVLLRRNWPQLPLIHIGRLSAEAHMNCRNPQPDPLPRNSALSVSTRPNRIFYSPWLTIVVLLATGLGFELLPNEASADDREFDLVLTGGRLIDPESGRDEILNVGIMNGRIAAIGSDEMQGAMMLDVAGHVVAPGFIDLHTHSPTPLGQKYQILDGVTTALELEAGAFPVTDYGGRIRDRALNNYGASAGYGSIRLQVKNGLRQTHIILGSPEILGLKGLWTAIRSLFSTPREVLEEVASANERLQLRELIEEGLDQGGLGIGLPLDYMNEAVNADEIRMIFETASERDRPIFVHIRRGINGDPAGLYEVLGLAAETGASLHICHLSHNAMRATNDFLSAIAEARGRGVDVTTEVLPYNAGSALISSAVFGRDWRTIFAIDYEDVEWAATGERFNESMWQEYREKHPEGQVIHHYLKEEWTRRALVEPGVMVVSDLLPMETEESKVAPHNGTFARILGHYVREEKLIDLETALAKMTIVPARRLEKMAPVFRRKGRLRVGADADITIFDPEKVIDRATYQNPYQASEGINYVIVNGELVVRDGEIQEGLFPGRAIYSSTP